MLMPFANMLSLSDDLSITQSLKQPFEVGLGRLDEHSPLATVSDARRPLSARVRPAVLWHPVHAAPVSERGSHSVEHNGDGSAELGGHLRHLFRHVHLGLVVEHPAFEVELTGDYDALKIEQLLKCGHECVLLSGKLH